MSGATASEFSRWEVQPAAAQLLQRRVDELRGRSAWLRQLSELLLARSGTRLFDWIDTVHVPVEAAGDLTAAGFSDEDPQAIADRWHHPGAQLPWVVADGEDRLVLRVDSVVDFLRAHAFQQTADPQFRLEPDAACWGAPSASRRGAEVSRDGGVSVVVLERHGDQGPAASDPPATVLDPNLLAHHGERLRLRRRNYDDPLTGIEQTIELVEFVVADLGTDAACDLFFQTEREYWQLRNDAAARQYRNQNQLGFGWANHDHHTYRSSRRCFAPLIRLLETLGMQCRERFYAGADAGWGAQVLEQPAARIVVFADVDMSADEVLGDFAHEGLADTDRRGTVGLWCHLHGEAVLQAGMHHLECQFDFAAARQLLEAQGAASLEPFSNFDYLKQSFTRGQVWPVDPHRVREAERRGWINAEQAHRFLEQGVTGSHLEVLERNDGYKGFNQTGISDIIARTDPRNAQMQ